MDKMLGPGTPRAKHPFHFDTLRTLAEWQPPSIQGHACVIGTSSKVRILVELLLTNSARAKFQYVVSGEENRGRGETTLTMYTLRAAY